MPIPPYLLPHVEGQLPSGLPVREHLSIPEVDGEGRTALHYTASNQALGTIKYRLSRSTTDIFRRDLLGLNACDLSIMARDKTDALKLMLDSARENEVQVPDPYSLMSRAASYKRENVMKYLLERYKRMPKEWVSQEAFVDAQLLCASELGDADLAERAIQGGARIGHRPLSAAIRTENLHLVRLLLGKGCDSLEENDEGLPVVCLAAKNTGDGRLAVMNILLDACPKAIAFKSSDNRTALHYAAKRSDTEMARILIDRGISFDEQDINGWSALHEAVAYASEEMVALLLENGADPYLLDRDAQTPLYLAVKLGRDGATHSMLSGGVNVNHTFGFSEGRRKVPLSAACASGSLEMVEMMVRYGAIVDLQDSRKRTPLFFACLGGFELIVKFLITRGADVGLANNAMQTPLHAATSRGWDSVVKLLLQAKAVTEAPDSNGRTALHVACLNFGPGSSAEVIKLLVEAKANVSARDKRGKEPEMASMQSKPLFGASASPLLGSVWNLPPPPPLTGRRD